jgi:hypothetical protein
MKAFAPIALAVLVALVTPSIGRAQQTPAAGGESAELAKKLSNPISDLVSVPFQFNWEQNVGPSELTRFILNVQPVMPFEINQDWNMIARVIMPLVSQPPLFAGGEAAFGVSDITTSFFFSPRKVTRFTIDGRRAQTDWPLDVWCPLEPGVVILW